MQRSMRKWFFAVLATLVLATPTLAANKPKLVVMIVVDQGRHDYPLPRPDGYGKPPGGSKGYQILKQGTVYLNAAYAHSVTVTEPGHMTLITGGSPNTHGIPRNGWLNRDTGKFVNDIYDPDYWIVGNTGLIRDDKPGTAPTALLVNTGTIGDSLIEAHGEAKVFSIAMGDWPTIPIGGRKGKALWYDYTSGEFVSSDYFYKELPSWVQDWNKTHPLHPFLEKNLPRDPKTGSWVWELLYNRERYKNAPHSDTNALYTRPACFPSQNACTYSLGHAFNHYLPNATPEDMLKTRLLLLWTPFADAVLREFAAELVQQEGLGQDETTDLLVMSLASTDLIGHMWGPDSLEHEDNFYRLDVVLEGLINALTTAVPKEDLLLVLSADHGMNSIPEFLRSQGISAGRLYTEEIVQAVNASLLQRYGMSNLALGMRPPSLFLDLKKIERTQRDVNEVAQRAVETIRHMTGVRYAWTKQDLFTHQQELEGVIEDIDAGRKRLQDIEEEVRFKARMLLSVDQNPTDRSGEVLIVQEKNWYFHELETDAAMHGSPYDYSSRVQLMFWGGPIKQAEISDRVRLRDIVPTIAKILDIDPPVAAQKSKSKPLRAILDYYGIAP